MAGNEETTGLLANGTTPFGGGDDDFEVSAEVETDEGTEVVDETDDVEADETGEGEGDEPGEGAAAEPAGEDDPDAALRAKLAALTEPEAPKPEDKPKDQAAPTEGGDDLDALVKSVTEEYEGTPIAELAKHFAKATKDLQARLAEMEPEVQRSRQTAAETAYRELNEAMDKLERSDVYGTGLQTVGSEKHKARQRLYEVAATLARTARERKVQMTDDEALRAADLVIHGAKRQSVARQGADETIQRRSASRTPPPRSTGGVQPTGGKKKTRQGAVAAASKLMASRTRKR